MTYAGSVHLGGAIQALDALQRRGLTELSRDYVPYLEQPFDSDFPEDDDERSLWMVVGPTGNVSTSEVHLGLGANFSFTPSKTGLVFVIVSGMVLNSAAVGSGVNIRVRFNTGAAPVYGTAGSGNFLGAQQHFVSSTAAGQQGFCIHDIKSLTVGVAWWFDVTLQAVGAGGATVKDVQFSLLEF